MGKKIKIKLETGTVYQKEEGGTYYCRYQVNSERKCVSLKTANQEEAIKKARKYLPIVQTTTEDAVMTQLSARKISRQRTQLVNPIPMPEWLATREKQDVNRVIPGDAAKLRYVIQLANENVKQKTGGPFAAAIFDLQNDRLIALGVNVVVPSKQSWAHAEMTAFAHAQNRLHTYSLKGYVLVTSCEPCAMCSGATPWSGIEKMIYGATKEMAETAGFDEGYKGENWRAEFEKRKIKVVGPLLGNAANEPFELYRKMKGTVY